MDPKNVKVKKNNVFVISSLKDVKKIALSQNFYVKSITDTKIVEKSTNIINPKEYIPACYSG
jgi:hypothetical protein